MSNEKDYYYGLNLVRGISAILIVLYHYTTRYEMSIGHLDRYKITIPFGYMAVSAFFILTAILTVLHIKDNENIFKFLIKRMIRLYPVYWCCIVITTLFMFYLMPDRLKDIKTLLINFTMLQGFIGIESVDGAYWTLGIEILFYRSIYDAL